MNKKAWATVAFVMVVGGVLITFAFLGSQGGPRPMTPGPHHKLRFDLNNDLVGVETDPPLDVLNLPKVTDKRAIEKRVNEGCRQCHAQLPEHHPPKNECIKCHRMAPANAPVSTTSAAPIAPIIALPNPGAAPSADAGVASADARAATASPNAPDAGLAADQR